MGYNIGCQPQPVIILRDEGVGNDGDFIEVWGDGQQTRSYCYIDDCVEGIYRLVQSDHADSVNLGTGQIVSINELVALVARIAQKKIRTKHDLTKPQGVRGRNSDNSRLRQALQWEPAVSLDEGLSSTHEWIRNELI